MRNTLTFSFLLFAAHRLDTLMLRKTPYCPAEKMNWTEARLYCQKNHVDLVTLNLVNKSELAQVLKSIGDQQAWIGLLRDPEEESAWRWINPKSGEGISGDDLSQSSSWADGEQSNHCAVVAEDLKWHSKKCSCTFGFYCSTVHKIRYYESPVNWHNASQECNYVDWRIVGLATVTSTNTDEFKAVGWIGLYREAGDTWKWIKGRSSDYRNWAPGEPLNADCGSFDPHTEKWHSQVCSEERRFACCDDGMVVVNENKTWEEALSHCRSMKTPCEDSLKACIYRYDLLSLELLSDYGYVRGRISRATTDEVWTSLRFLGGEWWWANGQKPEDRGRPPDCPSQGKHCGTLSKYDTNNRIIKDCSERRNFICYREKFLFTVENLTTLTTTGQI